MKDLVQKDLSQKDLSQKDLSQKDLSRGASLGRPTLVSRRTVLGGLMGAVISAATLQKVWALGEDFPARDAADQAVPGISRTQKTTGTPDPRFQHAAAALPGGNVLVTGGWRQSGAGSDAPPMSGAQIFNPYSGTWTDAAAMSRGRALHSAVALEDGRILVVGGINRIALADAEIYDPNTDRWTQVASMSVARYGHVATLANGLVVVTGGCHKAALSSVLVYDVNSDRWQRSF